MDQFVWRKSETCRKLDTKHFCFLCLKPKISTESTLVSLANLRRHLKIKIDSKNSSENEFDAELCTKCEILVNKFSILFQQLEKVQMELDHYLGEINECITGVEKDEDLAYINEMSSNAETRSEMSFIDSFRKEISTKCSRIQFGPCQNVELEKLSVEKAIPIFLKAEPLEEQEIQSCPSVAAPQSPSLISKEIFQREALTNEEVDKSRKIFHPCPFCGKKFLFRYLLLRHKKRVHERRMLSCDLCVKKFSSLDALRKHENSHLEKTKECKPCHKTFMHPSSQRRHEGTCLKSTRNKITPDNREYSRDSEGMFTCPACPKQFKKKSDAQDHFDSAHLHKKLICDICNIAVFSYDKSLRKHQKSCRNTIQQRMEKEREREKLKFCCEICGNKFEFEYRLKRHHKDVHLNERKFPCDECEMKFKRIAHLERHKQRAHSNESHFSNNVKIEEGN